MKTVEEVLVLEEGHDQAVRRCWKALGARGFKKMELSDNWMLLTARGRTVGQWSSVPISVAFSPLNEERTELTIVSSATSQSITSLLWNPATAVVKAATRAIQAEAATIAE